MEICKRVTPEYREVEPGHYCACHLYTPEEEIAAFNEGLAKPEKGKKGNKKKVPIL
jgi:hypothetical protein